MRSVCVAAGSLLATISLLLFASAAFAQSDRGIITGTVTDPTGAVVANAMIEARQLDTGAIFPTTTTSTGNYTLSQLPVGPYEITATLSGFKKYVRSGITVQVAQTLRVDIPMEVGTSTESVTVSAEASLLKTETGDISTNVEVGTLDTLPILGVGSANAGSSGVRNPNNVLNVVPGAYYVPNSQVKINGAQTNSYAYHVEGQDSTNFGFPYAAAQTQPSVDAIQEVSVQTSNFAPEYGAVGGGFFNVTMKSGSNQFHGTVYDYFVNEILDAGTPFTNAGLTDSRKDGQLIRPRARRNDYGFTVGGPVEIPKVYHGKDKTFFFFNFEQFRETQIINNTPITVPTCCLSHRKFRRRHHRRWKQESGHRRSGAPHVSWRDLRPHHAAHGSRGRAELCCGRSVRQQHHSRQHAGSSGIEGSVSDSTTWKRVLHLQPASHLQRCAAHHHPGAEDRPVARHQTKDLVLLVQDQNVCAIFTDLRRIRRLAGAHYRRSRFVHWRPRRAA